MSVISMWRFACSIRTDRTAALRLQQDFSLLLAGVPAEEALVLVVLVVGTAHRDVLIVALWRREEEHQLEYPHPATVFNAALTLESHIVGFIRIYI